jgi:CubicO group peptidase (beta-lactamase class C family)
MSSTKNEYSTYKTAGFPIYGRCADGYEDLLDAFRANFLERGEIGATLCLYVDGKNVVDLWGGWKNASRTAEWKADTLCSVYSISKSMLAICMHILVDRGEIDLDAPVEKYWPQFGKNGKADIRVRHVLSHYCGVIFNDAAKPGDIYDWEKMIRAIEEQAPAWPPATKGAYNSVNFGYIQGELIRRVSGRPAPQFLAEELCKPLGAEFPFGSATLEFDRIAEMIDNPGNAQYLRASAPDTNIGRAWNAMPVPRNATMVNDGHRRAVYPSGGGFTTARSMARIYAMLANGGELDGVRILRREAVQRLQTQQWEEDADGMMGVPMRMSMGFIKNNPPNTPMGPNLEAFGHTGSNGALVFADPERRIAFATTTNYLSSGTGVGDRTKALVAAIF